VLNFIVELVLVKLLWQLILVQQLSLVVLGLLHVQLQVSLQFAYNAKMDIMVLELLDLIQLVINVQLSQIVYLLVLQQVQYTLHAHQLLHLLV